LESLLCSNHDDGLKEFNDYHLCMV